MSRRETLGWGPARLWRWRADRARDRRDWARAAKSYERYLARVADDAPVWIQLGHARKEAADLAGARRAYDRALDLAGGCGEALRHLAALWTIERLANAVDASSSNDWPAAAAAYAKHLEAMPDDGPAWVQYGHALKGLGDLPAAMTAYRQAVALPFSEEEGLFQLACALRSTGLEDAARLYFARALRLTPRLEIHRALNDSSVLAAAAGPADDGRTLALDISDLLNFLGEHGLVSGIQRVQRELLKAIPDEGRAGGSAFDDIVFCFSEYGWAWALGPEDLRQVIAYAEAQDIDADRARDLLERVKVQAAPCLPAPGSAYLVLGGFWGGADVRFQRERLRSMGVAFGVLTHDLFAVTLPELCEEGVTATFEASLNAGLESWDFVVANSAFTAGDMEAYIARLGRRPLPVIPMPLAHSHGAGRGGAGALPETLKAKRFVLCVGTIEPRKNHETLIEAWSALAKTHADLPELVLVGRRGWRMERLVHRLESGALGALGIRWLRNVSDAQLDALYASCLFTVFPSLAEGWGLPIGESLVRGKVCVTSNRTAMPEVGGRFAIYVDPYDKDALRAAIEALIYDGQTLARREALIRRSFRPRTWAHVARDLIGGLSALQDSPAAEAFSSPPLPPASGGSSGETGEGG